MMAGLLSRVDQPVQKQWLLGWEIYEVVDVQQVSSYRHWDTYFITQPCPGTKYEQAGLRAWLTELQARRILQGFELTPVRELSSNAAELLARQCEGKGENDHEGILLFGKQHTRNVWK